MKTNAIIIFMILVVGSTAHASIHFDDGLFHTINYTINDSVKVDYDKPGVGTTVELVDGGWIGGRMWSYYDSRLFIRGGIIEQGIVSTGSLYIYGGNIYGNSLKGGYSNVEIFGGTISGYFSITDYSQAYIYGGSISSLVSDSYKEVLIYDGEFNKLYVRAFSSASVFGGQISEKIDAADEGFIKFYGNNFYVNGNLMQYGQSARLYGIPGIDQYGRQYLTGTLTGVLSNGDLLNTPFYIYDNADITFVPEPATILLLSLGIVFLRKRS